MTLGQATWGKAPTYRAAFYEWSSSVDLLVLHSLTHSDTHLLFVFLPFLIETINWNFFFTEMIKYCIDGKRQKCYIYGA